MKLTHFCSLLTEAYRNFSASFPLSLYKRNSFPLSSGMVVWGGAVLPRSPKNWVLCGINAFWALLTAIGPICNFLANSVPIYKRNSFSLSTWGGAWEGAVPLPNNFFQFFVYFWQRHIRIFLTKSVHLSKKYSIPSLVGWGLRRGLCPQKIFFLVFLCGIDAFCALLTEAYP